ncbi:MAG: electron transfer flavoprotein subunit alpha [Spirochaetales bacterium]|nr:electron transfer flavoprotein subunit alpha [Spirochaetales bacterium]
MSGIQVIEHKCVGCKKCQKVCPYDAIDMVEKLAVINLDKCTLCGACVDACPFEAIVIEKATGEKQDISSYSGICVYAEHRNGVLSSVVKEIIGVARRLKESLDKPIYAIVVGQDVKRIAEEILEYGVDEAWVREDPRLGDYAEDVQADVVAAILQEMRPEIFLGGGTIIGRSLLPRVAVRLKTGLTADCTELTIDEETKNLRQTRPAFGGNIMATILTTAHRPQMATVRHKVMPEAKKVEKPQGRIVPADYIPVPKPRIEVLGFVPEEGQTVNLVEADIIVSAGRGIQDPKNVGLIAKLANAVGGALGASRAVVDAGWVPYSHQVGQTGKTVNPVVYIACGISGAIQHLAGMKSSDIIIAINRDANAPIFDVAHYGIVGNLFDVVPELIKQIEK